MNDRAKLVICLGVFLAQPATSNAASTVFGDIEITGSLTQVSDESYPEYHPRIDGDIVVFTAFSDGSENIVFIDLASLDRRQITTGPRNQRLQDVSGKRIAFSDYSGARPEVFVYDIDDDAFSSVGDGDGGKDAPAIDQDLVAYVHTPPGEAANIWVTDLISSHTRFITENTWPERAPSISGDFVAFERIVHGDATIHLYDLADDSERLVLAGPTNQRRPHLQGDNLVFDAFVDGRTVRDLLVYEIGSGAVHHIMLDGNQSYARIFGDWLAFDDDSGGISDIVLMHLPTGFTYRITDPRHTDFLNDIDGNRVVFTSNAAGKFDVWMYEFEVHHPGEDDQGGDDGSGVGGMLGECDFEELPFDVEPVFSARMTRDIAAPIVETHEFQAVGPGVVILENDWCASAWAKLNGEPLFVPDDLDATLVCLWGSVELIGDNVLELSVRSKPGCSVTLSFYPSPDDIEEAFDYLVPILACETGPGAPALGGLLVLLALLCGLGSRRPARILVRRPKDSQRAAGSRR